MPSINPAIKLDNPDNEFKAKWILDHATKQDFDYPAEFYEYTKFLWKDQGVQVGSTAFWRIHSFFISGDV